MKKLFTLLLALSLLLTAASAMAETTISVNGTGEVRVSADTAIISLGVNSRDKDVLKAQKQVNETIASIRTALAANGVDEENIITELINIYAIYDYQNGQEEVVSYNAGTNLAIKATDMESVGALIDAAFAAGANTLNGVSFSASDTTEAENEAIRKAVEDAKRKAEVMAQAAGLNISGIMSISEGSIINFENSIGNAFAKGLNSIEASADSRTVIQAAKLVISASINITFSVE